MPAPSPPSCCSFGNRGFLSRRDVQAFVHDAVHARSVRVLEIPGGTHFLHLERPEAGRAALLDALDEALRPDD
jgi:pimeloyl-ACP methyl ester carboxylesterase